MPPDFLHNHPQFADLIRIVAANEDIAPARVEKDYRIIQSGRCNVGEVHPADAQSGRYANAFARMPDL